MSVLLPLYIYPSPGAWDAVYWEANKNPQLRFDVIINPCSGPCSGGLPPQDYLTEIPKLKQWPNIRTLGYVYTNYTARDYDDVVADIQQYAQWPELSGLPTISVDGIFFDETPALYDWQAYAYLANAALAVRSTAALGQKVVVHNPGVLPDHTWNYLDIANVTVIFEESFINFISEAKYTALMGFSAASNYPKSAFAILMHSIGDISNDLLDCVTTKMKVMAGWGYVTSNSTAGEYWHSFSPLLDAFITDYAS